MQQPPPPDPLKDQSAPPDSISSPDGTDTLSKNSPPDAKETTNEVDFPSTLSKSSTIEEQTKIEPTSLEPPPRPGGVSDQSKKLPLQKTNMLKEPGWRLSSSSKLKVKVTRTRSSGFGELPQSSEVKSDTSISSNGPLRQFYRNSNDRLKHQPKVRFNPDPKLIKEAIEVAVNLEKLQVDTAPQPAIETALTKRESTKKVPRGDSGGKLACPVDAIGGYIGNSLDHIKLITYEDDEEDSMFGSNATEKSVRSGKSNSGKSNSSKRRKAIPKTATNQSNQSSTGGSPKPPPSTDSDPSPTK